MRKREFVGKAVYLLAVCALGMLATACFSVPATVTAPEDVGVLGMNPGFTKEEHSFLIVTGANLFYKNTDGYYLHLGGFILPENLGSGVFLAPGVHTLEGDYIGKTTVRSSGYGSYSTSTESADGLKATHDFLPGHYYLASCLVSGRTVSLEIKDITDSVDSDEQKLVQAFRQSTAETVWVPLPNTLSEDSTDPTPFEGTWLCEQPGKQFSYSTELTFSGNTIHLKERDWGVKAYSAYVPVEIERKGRFGYTDNNMTLYLVSLLSKETSKWTTSSGAFVFYGRPVPTPAYNVREYSCTLEGGTLTLTTGEGKQAVTMVFKKK